MRLTVLRRPILRRPVLPRRGLLAAYVCAVLHAATGPTAAGTTDGGALPGRWITPDRDGVIEIAACQPGLCGRIIGMSETVRPDGTLPRDRRSGAAQCGLTILRLPARGDDGVWSGTIENPDDGSTWRCEVWRAADGVHLRGYVLLPLLGRTQLWTPYDGTLSPDCRLPG